MANDRSPSTRERLLDAALARFSREGWGGTSIRDLARDVGIRESSVYKHFASKQAIFDALLERADERIAAVAAGLGVAVDSAEAALPGYRGVSEQRLVDIAQGFLDAVLHDTELVALRRLLVINQYRDPQIGRRLLDPLGPLPGGLDEGVLDGVVDTGAENVLEEVLALGGVGAQEPGELTLRQDDRLRELLPA